MNDSSSNATAHRVMTVLLAPNHYLPIRSGIPVFTDNLGRQLVQHGCRVLVAAPKHAADLETVEYTNGLEIHRLDFALPWRLYWKMPREGWVPFLSCAPGDLARLLWMICKEGVAIVNLHGLNGVQVPYILWAHRFLRFRLVVTLHGHEFFELERRNARWRKRFLRCALKRAARIVVISTRLRTALQEFYPEFSEKAVLIPNGVFLNDFADKTVLQTSQLEASKTFEDSESFVLSLARLNPLKGHDVLLAALENLKRREKRVRLVIAGDGSEKVRLHALALALGIKDRVTFIGETGAEHIRPLLAGCEFLVLSSWNEGVPTVLLEAMASGKAVIATDVGGVSEIVRNGHNGLLVPPGDARSLAEAMATLLENPNLCAVMGERGREMIGRSYDFPNIAAQYLAAYREVLRPSPTASLERKATR